MGATFTTVADEKGDIGLLAIDGDNDALAAVLGATLGSLEREVAHGDKVVGVDVVERLGLDPVAHDRAHVLVVEVGAAGLALLDVVVVCAKALAFEEGLLSRSASGESESSEGTGSDLHIDHWGGKRRNWFCDFGRRCIGELRLSVRNHGSMEPPGPCLLSLPVHYHEQSHASTLRGRSTRRFRTVVVGPVIFGRWKPSAAV